MYTTNFIGNIANNDLTAQTTTSTIIALTVDPASPIPLTLIVGVYLNVISISGGKSIRVIVTFTDPNNVAKTFFLSGPFTTVSYASSQAAICRCKPGTVLTLATSFDVATGSINFDTGGFVNKFY